MKDPAYCTMIWTFMYFEEPQDLYMTLWLHY